MSFFLFLELFWMSKGEPFTTELLYDGIYDKHPVLKSIGSDKERRRMRLLLRKQGPLTWDEQGEGDLTIQVGRISAYYRLRDILPDGNTFPAILRISNETMNAVMQVTYIIC